VKCQQSYTRPPHKYWLLIQCGNPTSLIQIFGVIFLEHPKYKISYLQKTSSKTHVRWWMFCHEKNVHHSWKNNNYIHSHYKLIHHLEVFQSLKQMNTHLSPFVFSSQMWCSSYTSNNDDKQWLLKIVCDNGHFQIIIIYDLSLRQPNIVTPTWFSPRSLSRINFLASHVV
jgi:hypothetical protein